MKCSLNSSIGHGKGGICRGKGRYLGKMGGKEGGKEGGDLGRLGFMIGGLGWGLGWRSVLVWRERGARSLVMVRTPPSPAYRPGCVMLSGDGCDLLQHLTRGSVLLFSICKICVFVYIVEWLV